MPSFSASFIRLYLSWVVNSKSIVSSPDKTREALNATYLRPSSYSPPQKLAPGISINRVDLTAWPLYRVSASSSSAAKPEEARGAILYIHGGSFFKEIHPQHWAFVCQLAQDTGLDVLVPIYPLIPGPTATAAQLARGFMDICRLSTQPIVCIAGDSAGGMLALATGQQLQKNHPELAAKLTCLVLISPVLDTALNHPEVLELEKNDPWLATAGLQVLIPFLAGGLSTEDPAMSPLYGEIDGLPPVLLFCGTDDMLCADSRRLSAKYQGKGTDRGVPGSFQNDKLTYVEKPDMIHVYPILPHAEGAEAREMVKHFIGQHVA